MNSIYPVKRIIPAPFKKEVKQKMVVLKELFARKPYSCPVCNHAVSHFSPLPVFHINEAKKYGYIYRFEDTETLNIQQYQCPRCLTSDRERLYAIYFNLIFDQLPKNKTYQFLDFAPSTSMEAFFRGKSFLKYRTADFIEKQYDDYPVNIEQMDGYADQQFDFFICSHVLEHVPHPDKAMRELHRILKPDGKGIVMLPIIVGLEETQENPSHTTEAERWKYYGQGDHLRMFGKTDFVNRLGAAGFVVEQLTSAYFGTETFDKNGISQQSVLYVVSPRQ